MDKYIYIEMTGSPREHGFKTKEQFVKSLNSVNVFQRKLEHGAEYLITNDLSSDTAKMRFAKKRKIKIKTYSEFVNEFKQISRTKKLQDLLTKIKK